jgi:hypothetical protein
MNKKTKRLSNIKGVSSSNMAVHKAYELNSESR